MTANAESGSTLVVDASLLTDVGCVRDGNEDAGRLVRPGDPAMLAARGILIVVADGMGGHSAGEVASHLAIEAIHHAYYDSPEIAEVSLREALREANRRIFRTASEDRTLAGMGTTCTALVLRGDTALCAHVGDSRLYLVRDARIYQMTEDHSVVQRMVADGSISRAAARHHAERNVILRALGTRPDVEISAWDTPLPVQPGDRFVVCSDGLSDLVADEDIKDAVLSEAPGAACHRLVQRARERGGYDNITVAIAEIRDGRRAEASPPETRTSWVGSQEPAGNQSP